MNWQTVMGAGILLYVMYILYRGTISFTGRYGRGSEISRSERPGAYWTRVAIYLAVALVLLFNLFPF